MATDNHRPGGMLFPDPVEHDTWARPELHGSTGTKLGDSPTPAPAGDDTTIFEDDIDEQAAPAAAQSVATAAPEQVPTAVAPAMPAWVAAHIPVDALVAEQPPRRFRRSSPPPVDIDNPTTGASAVPGPRSRRWVRPLIGITAAAVAVVSALVVITTGEDPGTTAPIAAPATTAQQSSATASSTSTPAAAPAWCTPSTTPDATTIDTAGDTTSGVGVIAAFEHAFYVARSGQSVAAVMRNPAPVERIQSVIDRTPNGTQHCATIATTPTPDTYAVSLALRTPSGSESVIRSRINATAGPEGFRINTVEENR